MCIKDEYVIGRLGLALLIIRLPCLVPEEMFALQIDKLNHTTNRTAIIG